MVLPNIPDFPEAPICSPEETAGPFAVLTKDRREEAQLTELAERYGPRLLAPEVWSKLLPRCGVLISSAVSGGTFRHRIETAAKNYPRRCWLLIDPMSVRFPLPFFDENGRKVTITNYSNLFHSEHLCCQYTHFIQNQQGQLILWDTEQTIKHKAELAKSAGFLGFVTLSKELTPSPERILPPND